MRTGQNRQRILDMSMTLYYQSGTVAVTTNHIVKELKISPGNLYFHFADREAIVRELFKQMCNETYALWRSSGATITPTQMIKQTFDLFWKFRFFHREMYHLRRKDPLLSEMWHRHMKKCNRLLAAYYGSWVKAGIMRPITDQEEMQMVADVVLITSSTFLQFFESKEKPATKRALRRGMRHVIRFLLNYHANGHYALAMKEFLEE